MPSARLTASGREVLARLDQFEEFLEEADCDRVVGGGAGDGDLVAANVDVAVEAALDDAKQFIARAEQRNHGLLAGNDDDGGDAIRAAVRDRTSWAFCSTVADLSTVPAQAAGGFPAPTTSHGYPGGQAIGRPASTWAWTWNTLCPTPAPVLNTVRKSVSAERSATPRIARPDPRLRHPGSSARSTMSVKCSLRDHQHVRRAPAGSGRWKATASSSS